MVAPMVGSAMGQAKPRKQSRGGQWRQADGSKEVSVAVSMAGSAMGRVRKVSGQCGQ